MKNGPGSVDIYIGKVRKAQQYFRMFSFLKIQRYQNGGDRICLF